MFTFLYIFVSNLSSHVNVLDMQTGLCFIYFHITLLLIGNKLKYQEVFT